jgi:phage-related protein
MTCSPFLHRQSVKRATSLKELRIQDSAGAFRVIYVAKFAGAVYVLHCLQKKIEKTSEADLDLAARR